MSCNHCGTKFNFFHKEMGCASCRLSFCSKCLKQKCKLPTSSAEQNVCKLCFVKLTSATNTSQPDIAPPDVLTKRLESLKNPPAKDKPDRNTPILHAGLASVDKKLMDRLEKLKEDGKRSPPSDSEIRERLAKLKGENNYAEGPSRQVLPAPDTRTDQQKADLLLEQFVTEREIELARDYEENIEARLATLREQGIRPNTGSYISNLHDSSGSEEEVDKITKKVMDEVALDERIKLPSDAHPSPVEEEEPDRTSPELPWCVLCNDDAKYKCLDCSGDLYCGKCNAEVHRTWGDTDHKVVPYKPK